MHYIAAWILNVLADMTRRLKNANHGPKRRVAEFRLHCASLYWSLPVTAIDVAQHAVRCLLGVAFVCLFRWHCYIYPLCFFSGPHRPCIPTPR